MLKEDVQKHIGKYLQLLQELQQSRGWAFPTMKLLNRSDSAAVGRKYS